MTNRKRFAKVPNPIYSYITPWPGGAVLRRNEEITHLVLDEVSFEWHVVSSQKRICSRPQIQKASNTVYNLEYELEFLNGEEIGIHKRYYPNGKIQSIKNFDTNEYKQSDEKGNLIDEILI